MQLLSYHYKLQPFHSLVSKTIGKIYIAKSNEDSIEVSGPDTLLEFVGIREEEGTLELYVKDAMTFSLKSLVNLHRGSIVMRIKCSGPISSVINKGMSTLYFEGIPNPEKLSVLNSGVGDIHIRANTQSLDVNLKGIGNINLHGKCEDLTAVLRGSGKFDAYNLLAQNCDVRCDGVGISQVNVNQRLKASVNGIGSIKYRGNPHTESSILGLGKIERVA